jgi:DNA-binding NarL/FixJ family response regulator
MPGGTLVVSKAKLLYPDIKYFLEQAGFRNVAFTGLERDALYMTIKEQKPSITLIDCDFNQAATPFIVGEILKCRPKLNIAAFAVNDYPLTISAWFLWFGAKSCLHLWAGGLDEFKHGLTEVRNGNKYITPVIQNIINLFPDWPETKRHVTRRQFCCLIFLCCGLNAVDIASEMHVTRKTIDNTLSAMFNTFNVHSQIELMSRAWSSGVVNKEDLRFFCKYKDFKLPGWAVAQQRANAKLQKIYERVYGNE